VGKKGKLQVRLYFDLQPQTQSINLTDPIKVAVRLKTGHPSATFFTGGFVADKVP
jgi:hypothetical protein